MPRERRATPSRPHAIAAASGRFRGGATGRLARITVLLARSRIRLRRAVRALAAAAVVALALGSSPAGAAAAPGSLTLLQQTNWVTASSGFIVKLGIVTSLPQRDVALSARLYPRLESRYALEHQPFAAKPSQVIRRIAIHLVKRPGGATSVVRFKVAAGHSVSGSHARRTLRIDCLSATCDGDYPLALSLVDRTTGARIATLATTLVYAADVGTTRRLGVAVALPIDLPSPALGAETLTPAQVGAVAGVARAIEAVPNNPITLSVYGEMLAALESTGAGTGAAAVGANDAIAALAAATRRSTTVELLATPYSPIDLTSLIDGAGPTTATRELSAQIDRTTVLARQLLGRGAGTTPFVVPGTVGPSGASALGSIGLCDLVLPLSNLTTSPSAQTISAPLGVSNGAASCAHGTTVAVSDPGYAAIVAAATSPVLAAHQLIADLAQTYFENPNSSATRGVVVAPRAWSTSAAFVATLESGLRANPMLQPVMLSSFFSAPAATDSPGALTSLLSNEPIHAHSLASAYANLGEVRSVTPNDVPMLATLTGDIFRAESYGLSTQSRAALLAAPRRALATIASDLHLSGSTHFTFTASSGKIPITIHYAGVLPARVDLRIRSSSIEFPAREARQHLVLSLRDTNEVLRVSTRTSGGFSFTLELLVPHRETVLLGPTTITIASTAVSGVAIALSLAALVVLGLWWSRSIARHRREKLAKLAGHEGEAGPAPS